MSGDSSAEYDAFGPWILQVTTTDELPRLFRDVDLRGARLTLKVPRSIERRYATPSMDLYDFLVVARDESVTVFARDGQSYSTHLIRLDELVLIEVSVNLLVGLLRLVTAAGAELLLPFNAVSEGLIARLVDLLRVAVSPSPEKPSFVTEPPPGRDDLGVQDVWVTTQYRDLLRERPGLEYYGGYGRLRLAPHRGVLARLAYLVRPAVLHAVIACGDSGELVLLASRPWIIRGRAANYSRARTIIRPASVTSLSSRAHPTFRAVTVVTLKLGSAVAEYPVRTGSRVEATLLALAGSS